MVHVREADRDDLERLVPLFSDMERHYANAGAATHGVARERLARALAMLDGGRAVLVALEDEGEAAAAIGFACLFELFPGVALQPVWFLKELYVGEAARGRQVGEALMRAAARLVTARGGSRLDLTTDLRNTGAQRFYNRLGAAEMPKVSFRFDRAGLARLAGEET